MVRTIGAREQKLREQREAALKGIDGKDLIGRTRKRAREAFEAARAIPAVKVQPAAKAAKIEESVMESNATIEAPSAKKPTHRKPAAKATKKAKGSPAKRAKGKTAQKVKKVAAEVRPGTKTALIGELLSRKAGCTAAEVMAATGWPSVSMPAQAKALGVKLRKEKDGKASRYFAA